MSEMSHSENDHPSAETSSPEAPKLNTADLPPVDDEPSSSHTVMEENEFSSLTPIRQYEMNQEMLDETISTDRPLIAALEPMASLRAEYEGGSPIFVKKIDWLIAHGYTGVRRARGDGDCFYRSLAFAYIERILLAPDPMLAAVSAISILEVSQPLLEAAGFQKLVYEDFYDTLVSLINSIVTPDSNGKVLTQTTLLEAFNTPEVSNSIVVYLRLLTSAQMRSEPEKYADVLFHPELDEPMELREFCENFVEAVGKEADHPQIAALTSALTVHLKIASLDRNVHGSEEGKVDFVEFQNQDESGMEPIILLFRPGHYDILDRRSEELTEMNRPERMTDIAENI
ncbi:cysteine proteinase [Laetiporus sulphureus 93-53]|uniref:ubiquitinyl hydrolase 1 n=1 Tax=Laetiporus sulphureus 93-53 TaxID=1314785 RepID=A0A165DN39_9APHY|nr:cysteine proteinase [Laetiporus sulphureus 93-53]KZT05245.1 cysteine proteinase [Laetiporus sulphureus 93-53]